MVPARSCDRYAPCILHTLRDLSEYCQNWRAKYRGCMQQTDPPVYAVNEQGLVVAKLSYLDCKYDLIVQYDMQGLPGVIPLLCL